MKAAKVIAITLALVLAIVAGTLIALTYDNPVNFGCRLHVLTLMVLVMLIAC